MLSNNSNSFDFNCLGSKLVKRFDTFCCEDAVCTFMCFLPTATNRPGRSLLQQAAKLLDVVWIQHNDLLGVCNVDINLAEYHPHEPQPVEILFTQHRLDACSVLLTYAVCLPASVSTRLYPQKRFTCHSKAKTWMQMPLKRLLAKP